MANPNYKVDPVYTAPTTTAPKESSGNVSTKGAPQVPTVGKLVLPSVEFGDVPFTVQPPTSNSKGEWKFTSSKTDIAQIVATTGRITIAGAGTTTITATQASTKDFETISVTAELIVARATPVLGAFTTTSRTVGEEAFALASPTSTSSAAFKMESSDDSVARFSKVNGRLSIVGAGKTTITASQPANDDYLAASKNFVLTVRKGTPVLSAIAELSSTFGEVGPAIGKPTSESRGAVTFTSSNTAVATVNTTTGQVSVVGAGTTTITATQAATDDYVSATQTMTFTVKQAVPTLGKITADSKTFGDGEFSITKPTSLSSGAFTFTSSDSKVVKITEEGKVTIAGAGTATITATQAAAGNYAANSVTAEVTIAKATPELSNISLTGLVFGDADSTLEPRSTSSGAFTFSSNNTRVLTVNEKTGRVRIVGAGTATITVKQASTTNYEAASSSVTVQVGLATPAFQRLDPIAKDFGDANFLFDWGTSPSDGAITYTSSRPTVATIDTTTGRVTIVSTGITTLTMSQAKGTNHTAATTVAVLTVSRGLPVYGDFVIDNKTWGAAPFLLTRPTTTSSGTFSFISSNTSVATVNSATGLVTVVAPGSTEITASQTQTLTHTSSTIRTTFVVDPATPTFGSFTAPSKTFGDATFTMTAPSSPSSGAFTFSSSDTNVATINSSTGSVTIVGAGSTTITASQAASSPYAARSTTATFTVAKATPSLSGFGGESAGLAGTRYVGYYSDDPNWFATAALQGQTVTSTQIRDFTSSSDYYSWQWLGTFRSTSAGTYNFCTASDDASHLWVGANATTGFTVANAIVNNGGTHPVVTQCGNITLAASTDYPIRIQFGEAGGGDAMSVYFTPPGGSATYNGNGYFFSGGGLTKTVGDQPFTPAIPSSASTGAITYSSSNPSVAAINPTSGLITVLSGGTTTITAEQASTSNYNSSTVSTTLTVLNALIVTTDEQGGTSINSGYTSVGGSISSSPGTPTRSGYTFNGWFTASSGGSALSFPYTHNRTADFTLYAQWTANTLTVTTDEQSGTAINNVSSTTGGSITSSPGTPTRSGYTFNGWFTASTGGSALSFPYTHNQTADFTLYAQWTDAGPTCATGGTCVVGDIGPGGGKIFYVHSVGTFACGPTMTSACKYLEAAPTTGTNAWVDQNYLWSGNTTDLIGASASGEAIGTGYSNTLAIVGQSGGGNTSGRAAMATRAYRGPNGLSDWFLPSSSEVYQLHLNKDLVSLSNTFDDFWSSTECGSNCAWITWNHGDGSFWGNDKNSDNAVRPIRAFGLGCANGGTCVVGNTGPGGGIVFYAHATGTFACGPNLESSCKYLEAAPSTGTNSWDDSYSQYPYSPYRSSLIGASGQGTSVGTGYRNTQAMINQGPLATNLSYAGAITRAYRGPANLSDWYLPSRDELEQLWLQRSTVALSGTSYISSTEYDASNAYRRYGAASADGNPDGKRWEMYVRPIRAFG